MGSTADTLPPVMVQEAENNKDKNDNCREHGDRYGGNRRDGGSISGLETDG